MSRRAKKKDQTQAYNEVASIEVSEKVSERLQIQYDCLCNAYYDVLHHNIYCYVVRVHTSCFV